MEGLMTRKAISAVILFVFILPAVMGLVSGGYHHYFHRHQHLLEAQLKQMLEDQDKTQKELARSGINLSDGDSYIFGVYLAGSLRRNDRCWMQKYSNFVFDSIPALSVALLLFTFVVVPQLQIRKPEQEA